MFHRIAKRLSKINRKGGSGREGGGVGEKSRGDLNASEGGGVREKEKFSVPNSKKLRPRSSSVSNLDAIDG